MKNDKMRKALSILLCVAMLLGSNVQVFAVGIDITDNLSQSAKELLPIRTLLFGRCNVVKDLQL